MCRQGGSVLLDDFYPPLKRVQSWGNVQDLHRVRACFEGVVQIADRDRSFCDSNKNHGASLMSSCTWLLLLVLIEVVVIIHSSRDDDWVNERYEITVRMKMATPFRVGCCGSGSKRSNNQVASIIKSRIAEDLGGNLDLSP